MNRMYITGRKSACEQLNEGIVLRRPTPSRETELHPPLTKSTRLSGSDGVVQFSISRP
ncbi:hypothetical protein BC629DRAFT_1473151 [Irpex lacteus]|nr:hypothetical protein BC629DRAFT_1572934 [Irpex lacteus]KAI0779177.1 hypothetical protein BC629DRAFT_1522983 [Irpex lacteus]KAI0812468.1 hypothetical protein BC629DRAFT_1473151 [Irpex lacteus]